jgi:adenylate cyclase
VAPEQDTAVCFADLVGFTRLGSELETQTLGDVVGAFGELAARAAEPPVRLVKTIGDAAMLVSREPAPLVEAALGLVEAVEAADLPAVRAGLAHGPAMPVAGDLYGHAVNLASRVTGIARPGSVLCTKEIRDAAPDFDWSFAGRHRLKGVGDSVPLYRARPADAREDSPLSEPRAGRPRR